MLPGLRRIDLTVNYRCPRPVVARAVRLVAHNRERFVKTIRPSPTAEGRLILAPDGSDETVRIGHIFAAWADVDGTRAILARTNAELLPAAAIAVEERIPFRAPRLRFLSEDCRVDALLDWAGSRRAALEATRGRKPPLLAQLASLALNGPDTLAAIEAAALERQVRRRPRAGSDQRDMDEPLPVEMAGLLAALIAWAVPFDTLGELASALARHRELVKELRRDDAQLTLATAHSTKGLEFDHVAVIGLDAGRFPSGRSLRDAAEPDRALEEERRLAYVAWTRARRSLTLVYDPAAPSPFLLEAFSPEELGLAASGR